MPLSVDELRSKVDAFRESGLNTQQIADELSLSQTTIQWLSSSGVATEDRPSDIQVGWRSIAVKAGRIEAASYIFVDIIEEEIGDEVDAIRNLRSAGADVKLCMVLANKSNNNELEGVPLRGLIRVVTV